MGCLGCGCLAVIVIFLGFVGLVGAGTYFLFKNIYIVSAATPETIAPYTGTDDVYTGAQKKITSFNDDVAASKTSTLTLSSDEVNALIYHNVDLKKANAQALVTLDGDQARVQASIASNSIPFINLGVKDRYFNLDATTGISFNPDTKDIDFQFHKVQIGDISVPATSMESLQTNFSQQFNLKLHQDPAMSKVLDAAKTISIKDGQFVVETK